MHPAGKIQAESSYEHNTNYNICCILSDCSWEHIRKKAHICNNIAGCLMPFWYYITNRNSRGESKAQEEIRMHEMVIAGEAGPLKYYREKSDTAFLDTKKMWSDNRMKPHI
jgi:hypothetical protein